MDRANGKIHTMGQSQQEANLKQCRTKETQGISRGLQTHHTAALGLMTPVSLRGKSQVLTNQNLNSLGTSEALDLIPDWALPSLLLGMDTELGSFCLSSVPRESLGLL